jgi:hypothetical protein
VLRVFKPEAEEERFSVLRPQGWRKGFYHQYEKRISSEQKMRVESHSFRAGPGLMDTNPSPVGYFLRFQSLIHMIKLFR